MRWETAEPPGADDKQGSQPARGSGPADEEHVGPLSFTRELKDDGRTLILYRRTGERGDG
jgi:hypothetical protein